MQPGMPDINSAEPSSNETDQATVQGFALEKIAMAMKTPPGAVPGSFHTAVLLTMHIALSVIVNCLRGIPVPFFRALMHWLLSIDIVHQLSDGREDR